MIQEISSDDYGRVEQIISIDDFPVRERLEIQSSSIHVYCFFLSYKWKRNFGVKLRTIKKKVATELWIQTKRARDENGKKLWN